MAFQMKFQMVPLEEHLPRVYRRAIKIELGITKCLYQYGITRYCLIST